MRWRRYTVVRQHDESDCGAAALATLALHHGMTVELWKLRELTGTDSSGTNFSELLSAARQIGFEGKGIKCSNETLDVVPLPAIAQVQAADGPHFVIIHRVRKDLVVVADPAQGVRKLSREAFRDMWPGYLLLLVPRDGFSQSVTNATARRSLSFGSLFRRHSGLLVQAFLCGLLMTLMGVCTSIFVQHLVDAVLIRRDFRLLSVLGFGMLLVIFFRLLFSLVRQFLLIHVSRSIDLSLIAGFGGHLLRLPMKFFETRQVGEILSRIHDATKIREAIGGTAVTAVGDSVVVLATAAVLCLYDFRMALLTMAFALLIVIIAVIHHPLVKKRSRRSMESAATLYSYLVENVTGVSTIKAHGIEPHRADQAETRLARLVASEISMEKLRISMDSTGSVLVEMAGLLVLWVGGSRIMDGGLTIGQLLFFYTMLGCILEPLQRLASLNLHLQEARVAMDRFSEVLSVEVEQPVAGRLARFHGVRHALEFRDVSFRYGHRGQVLQGLNLHVPAGSTVAIVGESGSGKSTLLKLLTRFYEPTGGRILVDGMDLRDFDLASLRSGIGLVDQEPFIFAGTLRENITLGESHHSLQAVHEAVRAAGLEGFVDSLPERLETDIGERGANLSGGQRQRLAIARVLLRRPEIVVFDEATSHLDTATEVAIQSSLRTALRGSTVIMVAHRLSTVRHADIICVLEAGRFIQQGTHRDLIAQPGPYARLWQAQTDGCGNNPELTLTRIAQANGNGSRKHALEVTT